MNRKTHFLGVITARRLTKRSQVCSRYLNESTAPTSTKPLGSKRDLPPTGSDFSGTEPSWPPGAVHSSGERDPLEARPVGLSRAQGEARRPTKSSARRPHRSAGGTNPWRGASAHQERGARHVGPTAVSNVWERATNSGAARRPARSAGAGASARPAVNSNPPMNGIESLPKARHVGPPRARGKARRPNCHLQGLGKSDPLR